MTSKTNIPEGWYYEGEDPSVGIFGHAWMHDCQNGDEEAESIVLERLIESHNEGEGYNRVMVTTWELMCSCGVDVRVTEYDGDPDIPEDIPDWWAQGLDRDGES